MSNTNWESTYRESNQNDRNSIDLERILNENEHLEMRSRLNKFYKTIKYQEHQKNRLPYIISVGVVIIAAILIFSVLY